MEKITAVVNEILESIFASDMAQQLLRYNLWLSILELAAGIILLSVSIYCFYIANTKEFDHGSDKSVTYGLAGIVCGFFCIPTIATGITCLIKVCTAPKALVIQQIADLFK